jgi:large subunit ribosomal protein L31
MPKKNLHPEYYKTKIFCDGQIVLEVGGTKPQLTLELWSGNHPFYTGSQKILDTLGSVEKFERRYKNLSEVEQKNQN